MALNIILKNMVDDFTEKNALENLSYDKSYEHIVNYSIISQYHPDVFTEINYLDKINVDEGSTFGIDGIAIIINDNLVMSKDDIELYAKSRTLDVKLIFIQTKTEEHYDMGKILKTLEAVNDFVGNNSKGVLSEAYLNAAAIYKEVLEFKNARYLTKTSPEVIIYYATAAKPITDKLVIETAENRANQIMMLNSIIKGVKIHLLSADHVMDYYNEVENRIEVNITFRNYLSLDKIEQVEQSYLGYLPCNEFLKIICDTHGNLRRRVFYENVRDFQGIENPVNNEIKETLNEDTMKEKFVLLNNGVTIVAKKFSSLGSNVFEMSDFNIVNGCQTSNVIYHMRNDIENVLVPIKIIHTTDADLITRIVKATNRQTPVPPEAFIALEKYHKKLQMFYEIQSKSMPIQIYYERRSGEYDTNITNNINNVKINLHSLIRAFTSVYILEANLMYNTNPANILKKKSELLFNSDHKPDIYYVSNYLYSKFIELKKKKILNTNDQKINYYIIMLVRPILSGTKKVNEFNSKAIEEEAKKILEVLKCDESKVVSAYLKAKNIIDDLLREQYSTSTKSDISNIVSSPEFNRKVVQKMYSI